MTSETERTGPITGSGGITNPNYGKENPITHKVDNRRFIPIESEKIKTKPQHEVKSKDKSAHPETGG